MVKPAGLLSNRYEVKDMPDLSGKVAVVTGGSRGIGEAAVSALVQKGCQGMFISRVHLPSLYLPIISGHQLINSPYYLSYRVPSTGSY
jgi:hypothetical protein